MMKKRLWGLLCTLFIILAHSMPVFAGNDTPLLVDEADLLTGSEENALLSRLEEVSRIGQADIVVVTINSLYGEDVQDYADDFYDDRGYAEDGILLLISIDDSEWYISTAGFGVTAVTDAGRKYMAEQFVGELSNGAFFDAFIAYADLCDAFICQARNGEPYDAGNLPKRPFPLVVNLLISLGIGSVAAFVMTGRMKGELKTVTMQEKAANYVKGGSMKVTRSNELFLYAQMNRQAKEKQASSEGSDTHTSSSGRTHGGGGGKF